MDIVLPFVDCAEKVWMKNYLSLANPQKIIYRWFYNYNTIKYVLRGIDNFMPYVDNVFLVVSNIEQIPYYIDQSKVKVILHKDFIPEKYLPTFQANTIEMCLYNITGLGEEFVYFNDDMIPVSPISYDELFKDGLPCINFIENYVKDPTYPTYRIFRNSFYEGLNTVIAMNGKNIDYTAEPLCPIHGPVPYLKSVCVDAASIQRHSSLLDFYTTTFRTHKNLNQYYWASILYFLKKYHQSDIKLKFLTTQDIDTLDIDDIKKNYKYLCINDLGSSTHMMSEISEIVQTNLDLLLPNKCKYEK